MACWNKVFLVIPYLDDIRSSGGEGFVRVCVSKSFGSLNILVIGLSFKESNWMVIDAKISIFSFCVVLYGPVSTIIWAGDDRLQACLVWGMLQLMRLASLTTSKSRPKGWVVIVVFKTWYVEVICMWLFSLMLIQYNLISDERNTIERLACFYNITVFYIGLHPINIRYKIHFDIFLKIWPTKLLSK